MLKFYNETDLKLKCENRNVNMSKIAIVTDSTAVSVTFYEE